MDQRQAVGNDFQPLVDQAVDDRVHLALVAGNGARGKDHAVAAGELDGRMLARADARHGGARLALAAGRDHHDFFTRQIRVALWAKERPDAVEIAAIAADLDDALQRPADDDHGAAGGLGRQRHGLHAGEVGGEGRHHDAARRAGDEIAQRAGDLALGRALAFAHDIGGIADEDVDALFADGEQPRLVGRLADAGLGVELPVAGVNRRAARRAQHQRAALGDRVRHGDGLDVERPERETSALLELDQLHLWRAGFSEAAGLEQANREARRIDLAAELRP